MNNEPTINREGDVVLVHHGDKPALYARIEGIESDIKKGWFQITLLLLTMPARAVTWILREEYINGEPFTMGGQAMRLEKVKRIELQGEQKEKDQSPGKKRKGKSGRVIPFKKSER
jgi:hypothetical protein